MYLHEHYILVQELHATLYWGEAYAKLPNVDRIKASAKNKVIFFIFIIP